LEAFLYVPKRLTRSSGFGAPGFFLTSICAAILPNLVNGDMQRHIAIVDDDRVIRETLAECLAEAGFQPHVCANGAALDVLMEQSPIDLVVVDLNLDGEDGLDIVKRIAEQEAIPLIIITGERIDDVDKAIGLEFGADDYLEKPFGLQEFIARIGVCLRPSAMPEERVPEQTFRFAGWSLNMRQFSLLDPDGNPVELSPNEFRVLAAMVRSPQTVLSREQLLQSRGHDPGALDCRSIDVVVNRLRRKLEQGLSRRSMIETERGIGYIFVPSVQQIDVRAPPGRVLTATESGRADGSDLAAESPSFHRYDKD
jgi:DNA-binding response OmpR family regulator